MFKQYKIDLTTSPILARVDSEMSIFLEIDWSVEGMGQTLMQMYDSTDSVLATIKSKSICDFNLKPSGSCLKHFVPSIVLTRSINEIVVLLSVKNFVVARLLL